MKIAGIDPGNKGAIALVDYAGPFVKNIQILRFSNLDIMKTADRREIIMFLMGNNVDRVFIENVNPFAAGKKAWKVLGMWNGVLLTACTASGHEPHIVSAMKWQGALNCRTGGDKNVSKDMAIKHFRKPMAALKIPIIHDNADALLISLYGYQTVRGEKNVKRARNSKLTIKTPW